MQASGIITFTTDFGHKGPFTGVMKGVVLKRFPQATIVDVAHEIPAHWPPEAGFWMSRSYAYFPRGTVHVGIVDPGVGTERHVLHAVRDGHTFLAPDNGLLDAVLSCTDRVEVRRVDLDRLKGLQLDTPSLTFHGRDVFAPIAAEIAAGRLSGEDVGPLTEDWIPGWIDEPAVNNQRIDGVVVTIDTFGNLITNIDRALIESFDNPIVHFSGQDLSLRATYGRAEPGDYLALINSFDVLEIARAEGSAADGLGASRGAPVTVRAD